MKKLIFALTIGLLVAWQPCSSQRLLKKVGKQLENAANAVMQQTKEKEDEAPATTTTSRTTTTSSTRADKPSGTAYPEIDGLIYRVNMKARYAAVSKVGDVMWHETDTVYIPDYINYNGVRYPVKDIDKWAFKEETLTKIRLPYTLEEISEEAFMMTANLKSVTIPNRVKIIKPGAFAGCGASEVTLSRNLEVIDGRAFLGMDNLKSIEIPTSVKRIDMRAFAECGSLVSVKLPSGLTVLGKWAFRDCKALKSISIPYKVTSIDEMAFSGCTSLTSVSLPDGLKEIKEGAFSGCKLLKTITFPAALTTIEGDAFSECGFASLTIPATATNLQERAFRDCMSLTHVTISSRYKDFATLAGIFSFSRRGGKLFDEKDVYNLKNFTFTD